MDGTPIGAFDLLEFPGDTFLGFRFLFLRSVRITRNGLTHIIEKSPIEMHKHTLVGHLDTQGATGWKHGLRTGVVPGTPGVAKVLIHEFVAIPRVFKLKIRTEEGHGVDLDVHIQTHALLI